MNGLKSRLECVVLVITMEFFAAGAAFGQLGPAVPWRTFGDSASNAQCDVINAANGKLVIAASTNQLVSIGGPDVTLQDTFVDPQSNFVSFEGEFVGQIGFVTDGAGNRSLWWVSLAGQVVSFDGFTGAPTETNRSPADFDDAGCDACEFWDDPVLCENGDVSEPPTFTLNLCGTGIPISIGLIGVGLISFVGLGRRNRRRD